MGDTGTAKSKVKTDYQRLARSTIGTQLLSLASPKTQSKSWWDPSQWVGSRCIGSLVQRNNHHILKLSLIIVWIFGSSQIFALFSSLKCDLHQSINLLTLFTFYVFTLSLRKKKKFETQMQQYQSSGQITDWAGLDATVGLEILFFSSSPQTADASSWELKWGVNMSSFHRKQARQPSPLSTQQKGGDPSRVHFPILYFLPCFPTPIRGKIMFC